MHLPPVFYNKEHMPSVSRSTLIIGVVALGVAAYVILFAPQISQNAGIPPFVACTLEAMICQDGSSVGREGPNCEFAQCPISSIGKVSGTGAKYNSGVRGIVMLGPTCPVETYPPDPECADKPYATRITIFQMGDSARVFATTESGANGTFLADLPPGDYTISAGEGSMPSCAEASMTVEASSYTEVTIYCDSGIR